MFYSFWLNYKFILIGLGKSTEIDPIVGAISTI